MFVHEDFDLCRLNGINNCDRNSTSLLPISCVISMLNQKLGEHRLNPEQREEKVKLRIKDYE